ncbi:GAF domain-containing protein [Nocardiopsis listeri]|uniref:GAF domain-containing protein n=1 Tax=Nocardiopsis listeri TaxID=53440 RepID=UPI0016808008|nr:GAF domain-containing protein [Nocardiopsis listeri]
MTERLGLGAEPDESMDCFASLAAYLLEAPVVITLAEQDRHVLAGLVGLGEPWSTSRQVPLPPTKDPGAPSTDEADQDPFASVARVARTLGAVSWIGVPLVDMEGTLLGFILAIDTVTRTWGDREIDALRDLAHVCEAELILRLLVEENGRTRLQDQRAYERSRLLMRTAEELAGATDVALVRRSAKALISLDLSTVQVELMLVEGDLLRRVVDSEDPLEVEAAYAECALDSDWPEAHAARTEPSWKCPTRKPSRSCPARCEPGSPGWGWPARCSFPCPWAVIPWACSCWGGTCPIEWRSWNARCSPPWPNTPLVPWSGCPT